MKSTLKIALGTQGNLTKSVIKIVQPIEVINQSTSDKYIGSDDSRDDQIKYLLQSPMNPWLNDWFEVDTRFPIRIDPETPYSEFTHYVTTIAAVDEDDLFLRFKNSILNRVIPFEDHVKINRGEIEPCDNRLAGARKAERIDLSILKHQKITDFFEWLESAGKATWEEQQPDGSQLK